MVVPPKIATLEQRVVSRWPRLKVRVVYMISFRVMSSFLKDVCQFETYFYFSNSRGTP